MRKALDFTRPHVLRDEDEYELALEEIDGLLDVDPAPGTERYERLEFLSVLVEDFEERNYPMEPASPQAAVDFMLEQKGMQRIDLEELMGGRSRVSEFFSGKRDLSKAQVEALHRQLGISSDILLSFSLRGGEPKRRAQGS
jgi:HTH-type transcriptional regulator/antitoxin HigA